MLDNHATSLNDPTRLIVYAQSIDKSKLGRIARNFMRSCSSGQNQPWYKKRTQTQDGPSDPRVKFEKGGCFQNGKNTCAICGKRLYRKCLLGTGSCS